MVMMLAQMCASTGLAADPAITVSAKQRYPWNGLVDLQFTITGDSGVKYDTAFTARDVVGGTNITMKTIRKPDGTAANVAQEPLLPGNYNWVWDAAADLPKDWKCDRVTVTGTAVEAHDKVQLWAGGPYWATTNIGANEPWESGYYFWWGDTVGYKRENNAWVATDGSSSNFQFYNDAISKQTYDKSIATLQSEGWIVNENDTNVLAPEHDAAQVQWGGGWRMPTRSELSALNSNCDWKWTTQNGVNGYVVRGRDDFAANSIFLPCTGTGYGSSLSNAGSCGIYWSSVPGSGISGANELFFSSGDRGPLGNHRYYGQPIRPVQSP